MGLRLRALALLGLGVVLSQSAPLAAQSLTTFQSPWRFHRMGPEAGISQASVTALSQDSVGFLWMGTQDGLNRYDGHAFTVFRHVPGEDGGLSNSYVNDLLVDSEGTLWVATFGGLNRYDAVEDRFHWLVHDEEVSSSLPSNTVRTLLEDDGGRIWAGTHGGLALLDRQGAHFRTFLTDRGPSARDVRALAQDRQGRLWVGTFDGLAILDRSTSRFQTFRHAPSDPQSLSQSSVWSMVEDFQGLLWFGTMTGGVNRHDPTDPETLSGDRIRDVLVDPDGSVWVATSGTGLNRIYPSTRRGVRYLSDEGDPSTLSSGFARALFLDREERLWVGTYGNGANLFLRESESFRRYLHDPEDPRTLGSSFVRSISQDGNGRIWFATDAGVSRMDGPAGTFTRYGVEDGLPSLVVYGILEADDGGLWMSTNGGLSRFDPRSGRFVTFTQEDGLQGDEFNTGAFWKEPDGTLYFGGVNGLTGFHPRNVVLDDAPPRVALTDFLLFNRRAEVGPNGPLRAHPSVAREIRLRPWENVFTLEFTGMSFRDPQRQRFEYRLLGFDERWIPTDASNRRATFTSLPPGSYTFEVRGGGTRGGWGEAASVVISVLPAFWQTLWFRTLALLALGGAFVGVMYWRFQDLRSRNVLLERRVRERTETLEEKLEELRQSSLRVKRLEGLLPICSACKRVRVEGEDPALQKSWVAVESCISARTDADFSHGICPTCVEELYPELEG